MGIVELRLLYVFFLLRWVLSNSTSVVKNKTKQKKVERVMQNVKATVLLLVIR